MTETTEIDQIRAERMGALTRRMEEAEHDLARLLRDSEEWSQRFTALSQQLASIAGQIERSESSRKAKIEAYKAYRKNLDAAASRLLGLGKQQLDDNFARHSEKAREFPDKTMSAWRRILKNGGRSTCLSCSRAARLLVLDRPHVTCTVLQDQIVHPRRHREREELATDELAQPEKFWADVPPVSFCDRFLAFEDD